MPPRPPSWWSRQTASTKRLLIGLGSGIAMVILVIFVVGASAGGVTVEELYLRDLYSAGITAQSDQDLIDLGYAVCDELRTQSDNAHGLVSAMHERNGVSREEASLIVSAAKDDLC
ncbi:DUF732 domain-containing protein [Gordonia rhizosphera]|uniref:DUF732 domain-containing protein n=1 Tax=Gordonia rhizosphera TaxID=83341 RepID=UPI0012F68F91|nr:DUF732 domain-containing protein [Gordonia rhizosphera]